MREPTTEEMVSGITRGVTEALIVREPWIGSGALREAFRDAVKAGVRDAVADFLEKHPELLKKGQS